jgi:hypothetical protein
MDPIGRKLSPEEQAIFTILGQDGRPDRDRTAPGVALSLERDQLDVTAALERLERAGLLSSELDGDGKKCWSVVDPD